MGLLMPSQSEAVIPVGGIGVSDRLRRLADVLDSSLGEGEYVAEVRGSTQTEKLLNGLYETVRMSHYFELEVVVRHVDR